MTQAHTAVQEGTQEACLAAMHQGKCLLLLQLPASSPCSQERLTGLSSALSEPLKQLSALAAEHFGALRQGHVPGLR